MQGRVTSEKKHHHSVKIKQEADLQHLSAMLHVPVTSRKTINHSVKKLDGKAQPLDSNVCELAWFLLYMSSSRQVKTSQNKCKCRNYTLDSLNCAAKQCLRFHVSTDHVQSGTRKACTWQYQPTCSRGLYGTNLLGKGSTFYLLGLIGICTCCEATDDLSSTMCRPSIDRNPECWTEKKRACCSTLADVVR
jgi:hypothetical protein